MNCPVCQGTNLVMSERQGIEVDYCPQCRGVWLDRGELDKIIERSTLDVSSASQSQPRESESRHRQPHNNHDDRRGHYGHKKKKKGGFLGELFDFD